MGNSNQKDNPSENPDHKDTDRSSCGAPVVALQLWRSSGREAMAGAWNSQSEPAKPETDILKGERQNDPIACPGFTIPVIWTPSHTVEGSWSAIALIRLSWSHREPFCEVLGSRGEMT